MQPDRKDLESLFAPAPGEYGTHLLLCGLSADTETLERIVSTFSGESKSERSASGIPRGLLMLDASSPTLGAVAVPGLLQVAPCDAALWAKRTSLMHAKVALMGFSDSPFAAPRSFRLVVSTGNWTRETWGSGSQIDLFWSTTWHIDGTDCASAQAHADVDAALRFFQALLNGLYAHTYGLLLQQDLAMNWWHGWQTTVKAVSVLARPYFIHSLEVSLLSQIKARFPKAGISTLVAGSGFFEQSAADAGSQPAVLAELESLAKPGTRYLVFNPSNAGAIASWIAANANKAKSGKLGKWTFCMPADPLQSKAWAGRTRLHAKYIAGLTRTSQGKGWLGALYIGSGNLSRRGLMSSALLGTAEERGKAPGNVEAGIFMAEKAAIDNVWRALACGDVQGPEDLANAEAGIGEPIFMPRNPPPVLFVRVVADSLQFLRSAGAGGFQFQLPAESGWTDVAPGQDGVPHKADATPAFVLVRAGEDADAVHEVPVFSEDGLLCRQAPPQVGIDDVLDALSTFPAPPSFLPEGDPSPGSGSGLPAPPSPSAKQYPLRLLASMIEAIAQRNVVVTKAQFPVWLSQLRTLLLKQTLPADRAAIRALGVDLFPALSQPGFKPGWLDEAPALKAMYEYTIADIRQAWSTPDAQVCPAYAEEDFVAGANCEEAA